MIKYELLLVSSKKKFAILLINKIYNYKRD